MACLVDRQLGKLAALQGWIHNGNLWGAVKVKAAVGIQVQPIEISQFALP